MSLQVGIVGLGRVGRGVLRANFMRPQHQRYAISVICDIMPIDHVAYLIAYDSTYGRPPFRVDYDGDDLILDGVRIAYQRVDRRRNRHDQESFRCLRPYGLDVLVDATGTASIEDFRTLLDQNITKSIVCTSNVHGCELSMVYGINHQDYDPAKHRIISASTCTGNALVPVCYMLDKHIGIDHARIITIHPLLADQRVLDGYHVSSQLGRTSATSIIPTHTNVGKSTELLLPALTNKLDSLSYRVPTAIVSIIDLSCTLSRDASYDEIATLFNDYAQHRLSGIIHCDYGAWGHQKASIDFMGADYSSIILMQHLTLSQPRQLGVTLMHDNEYGYCCRVLDVLGVLASA
ncbi:MAG: glyceraldehyde 3-phosphate dehydrogenase NAD-binding domain-containing protein [Methylomonas sp.]|jgi:glyceraldehyde 3-phosphate dehydrogenase